MGQTQVLGGTCIGIAKYDEALSMQFDLCIVDEASKATATETLVPLVHAKRWVLVGDQKQLPPFLDEALSDIALVEEFGLDKEERNISLFQRMSNGLESENKKSLLIQRRMTEAIGEMVSQCFYEGRLESRGPEPFDQIPFVLPAPITWWSTSALNKRHEQHSGQGNTAKSFSNPEEVSQIVNLFKRLKFASDGGNLPPDLNEILKITFKFTNYWANCFWFYSTFFFRESVCSSLPRSLNYNSY